MLYGHMTPRGRPNSRIPFSLLYGAKATIPAEIIVLSARLAVVIKVTDPDEGSYKAETLEERRIETKRHRSRIQSVLVKLTMRKSDHDSMS